VLVLVRCLVMTMFGVTYCSQSEVESSEDESNQVQSSQVKSTSQERTNDIDNGHP